MTTTMRDIVQGVLGPAGSAVKSGCNYRPQQEKASKFMLSLLESGQTGCVEGGTGIGKSYAYLVAAAEMVSRGKTVVISTATINLQEQLISKDIPAVEKLTGIDMKAVLVKGRSNYISLRRLDNALGAPQKLSGPNATQELADLDYAAQGGTGERGELSTPPSDEVWAAVASDKDDCMGKKCPHFDECPFYNARRDQYKAGVLIVNHSLLCADLRMRKDGAGVLPEYDCVVIDEAHEFPGIAATTFGERISLQQIRYLLKSVEQDALKYMSGATRESTQSYIQLVYEILEPSFEACHIASVEGLTSPMETDIPRFLKGIGEHVDKLSGQMEDQEAMMATKMVSRKCLSVAKSFAKWQSAPDGHVSFSEKTPRNISLIQSPILVGELLKEHLYDGRAVVMTSATLGTGSGLDFFMEEAGIEKGSPQMRAGSPFDYRKNVTLRIPRGMPNPSDPKYPAKLNAEIKNAVSRSKGGNLVLFTSYRQMEQCKDALKPWIQAQGYTFLCQGRDISRKEIVDTMKRDPDCVVFGTDSFWQGIDVPGRNLRSVVIAKLPFRVPNHPVLKKRFEILEKQGLNPFFHYSLPEGTMKLKQGFGRLIRNENDTGEVTILDSRLLTKAYGKQMLSALPECNLVTT